MKKEKKTNYKICVGNNVKVLLKGGMNFTGKLKGKHEEGIVFLEMHETFSCETKNTETESRILFIPWNSICYLEIL